MKRSWVVAVAEQKELIALRAAASEEHTERNWKVSTFPNAQQFRDELENKDIKLKSTVFRFLEAVYRKYDLQFETVKYRAGFGGNEDTAEISINDITLVAYTGGVVMYDRQQVYICDQLTDDFAKLCLESAA